MYGHNIMSDKKCRDCNVLMKVNIFCTSLVYCTKCYLEYDQDIEEWIE